jgi:hypothetical protein
MNARTAAKIHNGSINTITRDSIPARKVHAGMHVKLSDDGPVWTVLDRHPVKGHWWLHRWEDKDWVTTSARYSAMRQVVLVQS